MGLNEVIGSIGFAAVFIGILSVVFHIPFLPCFGISLVALIIHWIFDL